MSYRLKRFAAFVIDLVIILILLTIIFRITGIPDFPAVKAAMDAVPTGAAAPDSQTQGEAMLKLFNTAYIQSLLIWFVYEVVTQALFSGSTPGKLAMGLRIVSWDPGQNRFKHQILMIVRSAVKYLSLYLFQGFPFIIASLTIFSNKESRSGFDLMAKTRVDSEDRLLLKRHRLVKEG